MIAQKEYDEQFGPQVERYLTANGVAFRVTDHGGEAKTNDDKDGNYTVECDPVRFDDGSSVRFSWGMVNCTHMDLEGLEPQGRSGTAYAKLTCRDGYNEDAGQIVVMALYTNHEFRGWSIRLWKPFVSSTSKGRLYPQVHPHVAALAERLEVTSDRERLVRPGIAGRAALLLAEIIIRAQF